MNHIAEHEFVEPEFWTILKTPVSRNSSDHIYHRSFASDGRTVEFVIPTNQVVVEVFVNNMVLSPATQYRTFNSIVELSQAPVQGDVVSIYSVSKGA